MSTPQKATKSQRPIRIFIASSSESKSVTSILASYLRPYGAVTPWYLDSIWKPGNFILQTLLDQVPLHDFAIIVFGRDDKLISRDAESYSPRDNVIFEAGLFMARLGYQRTFVVAPRGSDLKILSDLAGLNILTYPPPDEVSGLKGALRQICRKIGDEVKQQKPRSPTVAARSWLTDFGHAHYEINNLLRNSRERRKKIEVCNIALDMEYTWSLILRDNIIKHTWPCGLVWRTLMIDGHTSSIGEEDKGGISLMTARQREAEIVKFCTSNEQQLAQANIKFECRAYSTPPLLHGFLIEKELHVGFCSREHGSLACAPYLSFINDSVDAVIDAELARIYIQLFRNLFTQQWTDARPVWPH